MEPLKKWNLAETEENAKIKRTITDSQNVENVENPAVFPAAENCWSHNILPPSPRNSGSAVPTVDRMPTKAKRLNLASPQNMMLRDPPKVATITILMLHLQQQQVI